MPRKLELRDYLPSHPESASLASSLEFYSRGASQLFVEQGAAAKRKCNARLLI